MAVWKDIKKKQIYMRQRIFRDGCLEARDCLEGKPEYADKCGKKCAGNLSYGDTGRVSRTKMEYYSQRNSETVTSCRMDTQDKGAADALKEVKIKMRSEYKRDMNHNYLILTGEDTINTDSYQVRMIVANVVPDLLQCRIQGIDGKFMVYYDVTSRHSMTALFENRKIGMEELQVILGGFIQVMEAMSEYLLNPCQLILEPEYIYLDAEKNNVRFCYMPGFHGEIQEQFQNLAEYLLPKLDHEDGKAVMLGYSVYRRALEDSFHLEYIKEELYKVSNGNQEDFEAYEKTGNCISTEGSNIGERTGRIVGYGKLGTGL